MQFWPYLVATFALLLGAYLLLRHHHWKYGTWIVCLSLAIFLGAGLNIRNLMEVNDAFNYQISQQMSAITNDIVHMRVQVAQSLVLTQQINQTVNLVTEVRKEVADVRETIAELFARTKAEFVSGSDTNRSWAIRRPDGSSIVLLRLERTPIQGSISVIVRPPGAGQMPVFPASTPMRNFVGITFSEKQPFDALAQLEYVVSYVWDMGETNTYQSVQVRGNFAWFDDRAAVKLF